MTDIAKCLGNNCPLKEDCYRYTAPGDDTGQAYLLEVPYKDGKCEYMMKLRKDWKVDAKTRQH